MSEREFWIDCIYDVAIDMGYDFNDYYTEEEGLDCADILPSEDLLSDLEHDMDDIIKNLDLDVYLDGRELLCEILDDFKDYSMCFEAIKDENYAKKLVVSYLLPEVAWKFTNS
jgi:hypothetical protein